MRLLLAVFIQTLLAVHVFSQSSETTTAVSDSTETTVTAGTDASATTVDPTATTIDPTATTAEPTTIDPTATTAEPTTVDPTATTVSQGSTVSGAPDESERTTVTGTTEDGNATEPVPTTPDDGPHADCYLCAPTVQCGETIEGDYSSADVNVLFMKAMEDEDYFVVKGEVFDNAEKIFFDVFEGLSVGKAQIGGNSRPTLVQFEHYYDTNLTFSRSGLHGKNNWDSFREATLPLSIRQKKPWTLMMKMHQNLTGFETGDETGWFNNHIPWNGTATTQSFNIRGNWKTTSITYKCANSSIAIL